LAALVEAVSPKAHVDDGQVTSVAAVDSLERELAEAEAELARARGMLANDRFVAKAPPAKVEEEREKERRFAARVEEIKAQLAQQ
jgi:valyl-tRNA synthetase